MFARKLNLIIAANGVEIPVSKAWLDQFFMRNFTGLSAFDETLPAAEGVLEAGLRVDAAEIQEQFEKWLRGRKMIPPDARLLIKSS